MTENPTTGHVAALLPAAGRSERMGTPKSLLPWAGRPLVAHQVGVLGQFCAIGEIVVVTGHNAADVEAALLGTQAQSVHNARFEMGRGTSIVVGINALQTAWTGVLIASVDQPLRTELVGELLVAWAVTPNQIVRPVHKGKHGHPVIFPGRLRDELVAVTDDTQGLRAVMHRHRKDVRGAEVSCPEALLNLNTWADYETAVKDFGAGNS